MIGLEDRRNLAHGIDMAHDAGAQLHLAREIAGIDERTLQRWKGHAAGIQADGRPQAARPTPGHTLSADERAKLLGVVAPRCSTPPGRLVASDENSMKCHEMS